MLLSQSDIIKNAKKRVEEITKKEFNTCINYDRKKKDPNHFYFLFNDELNIEIVISFATKPGMMYSITIEFSPT